MKKSRRILAWLLCLALCLQGLPFALAEGEPGADGAAVAQTEATAEPTATPAPTDTPTPAPTNTPEPVQEPEATATAEPTADPESAATATPESSETPAPSGSPAVSESPAASQSPEPAILVAELLLTAPKAELAPGETLQLSVSALPEDAADAGVAFASSDEAVLTVDEAGLVTAVASGEAVVTATAKDGGGAHARLTLTVIAPKAEVTALSLTSDKVALSVGETLALVLHAEPENADTTGVLFASGDAAIAVVDENGVVTGVAPGEVVITASVMADAPKADEEATDEKAEGEMVAEPAGAAISASLTLTVLPALPFEGLGTQKEPYLLSTREQLKELAGLVAGGDERCVAANFALTGNIEMGDGHTPIGTAEHPFEGVFDGRGYKLRGMMMLVSDASADAYGLFGVTRDAKLTRIAVEIGDLNVRGGATTDVGLIVGRMQGGSLDESYVTGSVETQLSGGATGGLVGRLSGGVIDNCFSIAKVSADQNGGVLAGVSEDGAEILHSYNRTEPADADIGQTVGQQNATLSSVYILSAEDNQAQALEYADATAENSYDGYDFSTVWTLDEDAKYPFPVLKSNAYTGVATYGPVTPESHAMGDLPIGRTRGQGMATIAESGNLPSTYDLRSQLPAVRNQNPFGTCWSFASVAALESNMIKQGLATTSVNLAELHTVYFTDRGAKVSAGVFEDPLSNFNNDHSNFTGRSMVYVGGNAIGSAYTYAAGMTPCEEEGPTVYSRANGNALDSSGLPYSYAFSNNRAHVSGVRMSNVGDSIDVVKQMVIKYGAVAVSYIHDDGFMSTSYSYYVPPYDHEDENSSPYTDGGGHAVAIVGWNDNYSKDNFISGMKPSENGAWLVRNSWGNYYDEGYFWASYECADFIRDGATAFIAEAAGDYDNCYQYDGSGNFSSFESNYGSRTIYAANVFEAKGEEKLTDVGFWCTYYTSASYEVFVYKLNANPQSPVDGTLVSDPSSGTADMMGFYKAPVSMTGSLRKGDKFSVVVKLTTPGQAVFDTDITGDYYGLSMDYYSYSKKGQSYKSDDGVYWEDINANLSATKAAAGENARIKGYTTQYAFATGLTLSSEDNATEVPRTCTLQMSAVVAPSNAIQNVVWSVTDGTGSATIDQDGLLTGVSHGLVTVTATSEAGDASGRIFSKSMDIEITPIESASVVIYYDNDDVSNGKVNVNVTRMPSSGYIDLAFEATTLPAKAPQHSVRWVLEPSAGASILSSTNSEAVIRVTGICSPKLTVTATDGSEVFATVVINAYEGPDMVYMGGQSDMAGGSSQQLSAAVVPDAEINQPVTWTVQSGGEYASVDSAGLLSTSRVTEEQTVTVRATTIDPNVYGEISITLHPVIGAIGVAMLDENGMETPLTNGQKVYLDAETAQTLRLRVTVSPAGVLDTVTVAPRYGDVVKVEYDNVSAAYVVTPVGYGAVELLITAGDAGQTRFVLNVTVDQYAQSIDVYNADDIYEVAVGKKITLKANALPETAVNRAVAWSLDCDKSIATVSSSGVVSVKAMPASRQITVTATSKDPLAATGSRVIDVTDAITSVNIVKIGESGYVTRQTLPLDITETMRLGAEIAPAGASVGVSWKVSNAKLLRITQIGNEVVLTPLANGTVTVTATSLDGAKKSNYVKINVRTKAQAIDVNGAMWNATDGVWELTLAAGKSVTLGATVLPLTASNKKLDWELVPSSSSTYATLRSGKLTAKKGTAGNTVEVVASTLDGSNLSQTFRVSIVDAAASNVNILLNGEPVNKQTHTLDAAVDGASMSFSASSDNGTARFQWKLSTTKYATLSVSGDSATITPLMAGTVKLTATAMDGSGRSAYVNVKIVKQAKGLSIFYPEYAAYKKSVSPTVAFTPTDTTNKKLTYAFENAADYAFASINASNGKLTVKQGGHAVTVVATAQDGSGQTAKATVSLLAAPVSSVTIRNGAGEVMNGKTISTSRIGDDMTFTVGRLPDTADSTLQWSLSPANSTAVALSVDALTNEATVRIMGNGTATIKASAMDGSGKSATVRVKVGNYVTRIALAPATPVIRDDATSLRVDFSYLPVKASSASFTWTASHGGKVKANKGYISVTWKAGQLVAGEKVTIECKAKTLGASARIEVPIVTATESITILKGGVDAGRRLALAKYGTVDLTASASPALACQTFTWQSLQPDLVRVTVANGVATLERLEDGVATVCVSATDGSGRKAYLIVTE